MTAPATLYLHVGLGRCGSGSIQAFGQAPSRELRARGLVHPSPLEMGFDADLARRQRPRARPTARTRPARSGGSPRISAADDADRFFMSAEQLLGSGDDRLGCWSTACRPRHPHRRDLLRARAARVARVAVGAGSEDAGWSQTLEAFVGRAPRPRLPEHEAALRPALRAARGDLRPREPDRAALHAPCARRRRRPRRRYGVAGST